ncbi:large terminase domain protein, partial [Escherichia coli 3.4880]
MAGEHADHLLYIIDEASGVSDKAFSVITGAL